MHSLKGKPQKLLHQTFHSLNLTWSIRFSEILQDPVVLSKLSDTKAAGEVKSLEAFYQTLQTEPAKAFYGKKHVTAAAESQAIETLLISDNLFRWVFKWDARIEYNIGNSRAENILINRNSFF